MNEYKANKLQKYITESHLITINKSFKIRIHNSLYKNYLNKVYDSGIKCFANYIEEINSLNIKYPGNANPTFYIYIVPDESFKELLGFSSNENIKGGGKPVTSYDLDSFPYAYGVSSNVIANRNNPNVMQDANSIHELAHLVHSIFFKMKNRLLAEGIADAITFYTLNYEEKLEQYRKCIKELTEDKILSAKELIKIENNFDQLPLIKGYSCSFSITYISSYLFIRACLETIESNFKLNRLEATQKLLEIIMTSPCTNEWGIFDIATSIKTPPEELLYSKKLQMEIIKRY